MPKVDTWMPIYWGDYSKDTGHLGAVHHGAYLMLIKHYWTHASSLPADDAQLWRIACCDSLAHWKKIKAVVLAFFEEREGRLHHGRVDKELASAEGNADRRTESARRAAEARWGKERAGRNAPGTAPRMPKAMRGECPPPSPSNNSQGTTDPVAVSASASPDGPPRSSAALPDSAKWAAWFDEYAPWDGKHRWKGPGQAPDQEFATPHLGPPLMIKAWRERRRVEMAKARGEAA